PVDALRIMQSLAKHLEPTTQAENAPSASDASRDAAIQTGRSQPPEVAGHVLRSRQDYEICTIQVRGLARPADQRHLLQRLELIQIRGEWISNYGHGLRRIGVSYRRGGTILVGKVMLEP